MAGGKVTAKPMNKMMPGKNGASLSMVFTAIIAKAMEANQPNAQRATTKPKPFAHASFFGLMDVSGGIAMVGHPNQIAFNDWDAYLGRN